MLYYKVVLICSLGIPYDCDSIMHFGTETFSLGKPTMESIDPKCDLRWFFSPPPPLSQGGLELPSMDAMGLPLPLPQTGASSIRSETGSAILIHGAFHTDQGGHCDAILFSQSFIGQSQSQEPQGNQGRREGQTPQGGQGRQEDRQPLEDRGQQGRRRDQRGDQRVQGGQTLGSRERNRS